jgi:tripartite-type tricarboxylate transporter receptor subunit TctC
MAAGPRVPADRVAALRAAFDALTTDAQFLADAKKRKLEIHPRDAAKVHALVETIVSASPELVARVKTALGDQGSVNQ